MWTDLIKKGEKVRETISILKELSKNLSNFEEYSFLLKVLLEKIKYLVLEEKKFEEAIKIASMGILSIIEEIAKEALSLWKILLERGYGLKDAQTLGEKTGDEDLKILLKKYIPMQKKTIPATLKTETPSDVRVPVVPATPTGTVGSE